MESPINIFQSWFDEAKKSGMKEPTAMNLATVSADGKPSSRIVLLKAFDERGFVFYTNSLSRKGKQIAGNPNAAINFFWMDLMKQVRIEGVLQAVSTAESDEYYNSRDHGSKIGAWASKQSEVMSSKAELLKRVAEFEVKFGFNPPRPAHWHGYRLVPNYFEFWQEGKFRLHDRDIYELAQDSWKHCKLYP
jgi:pyridoxamine 5'-phosphate oxidase